MPPCDHDAWEYRNPTPKFVIHRPPEKVGLAVDIYEFPVQLAWVAVSGYLINRILAAIHRLRAPPVPK
jgi:hypothetical protein